MGKLRKLQERYLKGELTKAQYEEAVKALLDEDVLDQAAYDDALEYDPEHERPQYSQAEVDAIVAKKATRMVRKTLKDAGVNIDADDKTLLTKVAEQLKAGGKTDGAAGDAAKATDEDLNKLRLATEKVTALSERIKDLAVENAVLKEAGRYNPVNPTQVVRALRLDYMDAIDYDDETGVVDTKSVARALKKVYDNERNLFKTTADDDPPNQQPNEFKGKGPGGGSSAKDANHDAKKAEALAMLGIETKK
jgi:hypothetical protein